MPSLSFRAATESTPMSSARMRIILGLVASAADKLKLHNMQQRIIQDNVKFIIAYHCVKYTVMANSNFTQSLYGNPLEV